jgi:hypothetical protein
MVQPTLRARLLMLQRLQQERNLAMRNVLLAAVALTGLLALTPLHASAASSGGLAGVHVPPAHALVTNVDYEWHHHYWHHRHWEHGCWHYWD